VAGVGSSVVDMHVDMLTCKRPYVTSASVATSARLGRGRELDELDTCIHPFSHTPMTTATESPNHTLPTLLSSDRSVLPDKYRGAVVEVHRQVSLILTRLVDIFCLQDLQLPPAFSLPRSELIARAIELAYDRDFSHIPYVRSELSVRWL